MRSAQMFDGALRVTDSGDVYRIKNGIERPASLTLSPAGYLRTSYTKNGKTYVVSVHRLVAEAFIGNPSGNPVVNHLDGIKTNNHASNLEWCTIEENAQHASRIGLLKRPKNDAPPMKRLSVTLRPEWEKTMRKLKKEKFFDKSQSEMIRHLIERGLEAESGKQAANI